MRARGLKRESKGRNRQELSVAPHAGAWIETVLSRPARSCIQVAPHAGAWIETKLFLLRLAIFLSRPMRARGLKLIQYKEHLTNLSVAPHAGAWIETVDMSYPASYR